MHFTQFMQTSKTFLLLGLFLVTACAKKKQTTRPEHYLKRAYAVLDDQSPQALRQALVHLDEGLAVVQAPQLYGLKASILFQLGHTETAHELLARAITLCDHDPSLKSQLINNYACVLAQHGDYDQALRRFKDLALDPYYQTPEVAYLNMARAYAQQGAYAQALSSVDHALELERSFSDAWLMKAHLCVQLGDKPKARVALKELSLLEQDPHLEERYAALFKI